LPTRQQEPASRAPLVVWLGDPLCADASLVGHKAAHLGQLSLTHPVPGGFCITTEAFLRYQENGAVSDETAAAIVAAYARLAARDGSGGPIADGAASPAGDPPGPRVAVRSSAVDEDSPDASFAGQHDTFLNVAGAEGLLDAVAKAWHSARSEAALAYRSSRGLAATNIALAVLVQLMVRADSSGVAFSVDPVKEDPNRIVVSANWGLGESLVGGKVNPDRWVFEKPSLALLEANLGDKQLMTITAETGTREVKVPSFLRERRSLSDDEVTAVAELTRELERLQGWPVDAEFAFDSGRLYLLQCRPVTTLPGQEAAPQP